MEKNSDFFWVVGFVEGEGCFSLSDNKYATFTIGSTDLDVIEKACKILGMKKICSRKPKREDDGKEYKTIYVSVVSGKLAIEIMKELRDFMGERRKTRIDYILEITETRERLKIEKREKKIGRRCKRGPKFCINHEDKKQIALGLCWMCYARERRKKIKEIA